MTQDRAKLVERSETMHSEMLAEGVNGWPNTVRDLIDYIEALPSDHTAQVREALEGALDVIGDALDGVDVRQHRAVVHDTQGLLLEAIKSLASTSEAQPEEAEALVDAAVEAWHDSDKPLHEWLGWTDAEYAAWVADPKAIPRPPKHFTTTAPAMDREAADLIELATAFEQPGAISHPTGPQSEVAAMLRRAGAALTQIPAPADRGWQQWMAKGERKTIARLANVARDVAWQAGVGGRETAGAIVSYLATSPDEIGPFVAGDLSPIDFKGDWMRGGCLSWHGMNGKIVHPADLSPASQQSEGGA